MIYKFRMVSDEADNFKREISIDADATFLDLRNTICDCVGYDKNQMSSFFLCDNNWEKEREITLEDMGVDSSDIDVYLMEDSQLIDHIEDEGQRLIFVFDYMTDRAFFIELKKIEPLKNLKDPVCTLSMGNPPHQFVDLQEFEDHIDTVAAKDTPVDIDEEFYGDESYNDDDLENLSDDTELY